MIWLAPLWLPFLLLCVYAVWIQHERGGWWRLCWLAAIVGGPLDVVLAHSVFALLMRDYPQAGEWTFSQQLGRLVHTDETARYIARILDAIAPSGQHIHPIT